MDSLNFDLKLQLAEYLFNHYENTLTKLQTIDKEFFPTLLFILRKYRNLYSISNNNIQYYILDKSKPYFKQYNTNRLVRNKTGLSLRDTNHLSLDDLERIAISLFEPKYFDDGEEYYDEDSLIDIDTLLKVFNVIYRRDNFQVSKSILNNILNYSDQNSIQPYFNLRKLFMGYLISSGLYDQVIDVASQHGDDYADLTDIAFDDLKLNIKDADVTASRNIIIFLGRFIDYIDQSYVNILNSIAQQTQNQSIINFINNELPTLIDIQ